MRKQPWAVGHGTRGPWLTTKRNRIDAAQVQFSLENTPNLLVQSYFQVVLATPTANYHEQKLEKTRNLRVLRPSSSEFVGTPL